MASYASIAASTKEPPQLLSPMVFTGKNSKIQNFWLILANFVTKFLQFSGQNQPQQPQKDLCNKSKPKSADLGKQTVAPTQQQQPPQVNLPTPQVQLNFKVTVSDSK